MSCAVVGNRPFVMLRYTLILAVNILGDTVRDVLDPRTRRS